MPSCQPDVDPVLLVVGQWSGLERGHGREDLLVLASIEHEPPIRRDVRVAGAKKSDQMTVRSVTVTQDITPQHPAVRQLPSRMTVSPSST